MVSHRPDSDFRGRDPSELLYQELRNRLTPHDFETWFVGTPCRSEEPGELVFYVTNRFRQRWMETHFLSVVHECARDVLHLEEPQIEFRVGPSAHSRGRARVNPGEADPTHSAADGDRPAGPHRENDLLAAHKLNPEFTFETFAVSKDNELAVAAIRAVAADPGRAYNPFVLQGSSGVGKTHLLHSLCRNLLAFQKHNVVFTSAEEFTNRFIAAAKPTKIGSFRAPYKKADVLVVDDIEFFAHKSRTQDQFYQLLADLLEKNRQVVLSTRSALGEIRGLHPRLLSRLEAGLIASLWPADFETRVAILLLKAKRWNISLRVDIAEYIASRVGGNVSELDGAFAKIAHAAALCGGPPTMESARLALDLASQGSAGNLDPTPSPAAPPALSASPTAPTAPTASAASAASAGMSGTSGKRRIPGTIALGQILDVVKDHYQVKLRDIYSKSKVRSITHARHVAIYLARELTPMSLEQIGYQLGGRDHSTVLYAIDRVKKRASGNPQLRAELELLEKKLTLA